MNTDYQIEVIRSSRKTVAFQIKPDGSVILRVPRRMKKADIDSFLTSKKDWIETHRNRILAQRQAAEAVPKLSTEVLHVFPEYWQWNRCLKENGKLLMARMVSE